MRKVNWYMLNDLLNPLGGSADMDKMIYRYKNFDSNDEVSVKEVINHEIKPYYLKASNAYKVSLKNSLSYFLTTNKIDFGRLYDSCLIAFDHPANPKDFFLWIWEVLYPGEGYCVQNIQDYIEVDNIDEPHIYFNKEQL